MFKNTNSLKFVVISLGGLLFIGSISLLILASYKSMTNATNYTCDINDKNIQLNHPINNIFVQGNNLFIVNQTTQNQEITIFDYCTNKIIKNIKLKW